MNQSTSTKNAQQSNKTAQAIMQAEWLTFDYPGEPAVELSPTSEQRVALAALSFGPAIVLDQDVKSRKFYQEHVAGLLQCGVRISGLPCMHQGLRAWRYQLHSKVSAKEPEHPIIELIRSTSSMGRVSQ